MAWNATLYTNFSKRINSTRQPSGGTVYPCRIKHDTDFKAPVLEIEASDLSDVNYMEFNGEYFYVTSVVSHRTGIWEVAGLRDPMATYKAAIGSTAAFMLYSKTSFDSSTKDYRIADERLAISRVPEVYRETEYLSGSSFALSPATGSFLLSAVGESGGVATYNLSLSGMMNLLDGINQDVWNKLSTWFDTSAQVTTVEGGLQNIRDGLCQALTNELAYGNYAQAIKACFWTPFIVGLPGTSQEITLGDFHTGVYGQVVGSASKVLTQVFSINIPWPVEDWKRNNCLVELYLPFCGTVVLPVDKINNDTSVIINAAFDTISGNISYAVSCGDVIYNVSGSNAAAPYAVGSSNVTFSNFMSGTAQAVGGGIQAATGIVSSLASGGIMGAGQSIGGVTSIAEGMMQAITPQVQCAGSVGGISAAGLFPSFILTVQYYAPIEESNFETQYGHPVFAVRTPAAGFNIFRSFSVDCTASPDEKTSINSMFNSGAYYE